MSHRRTSSPGPGIQVGVTPAEAGWRHLSFQVVGVAAGEIFERDTGGEEAIAVLLGGDGTFEVGGERRQVAGRPHVFAGLPHFAYAPVGSTFRFRADTPAELAWGSAPADEERPARILGPEACQVEMRGGGNVARQITHLVDPGFCQRLLVVEVYTPSGNWSSYPPHRHDADRLPEEVDLDEVYYYRIAPENGFAIQRLYDGQGMDDLVLARDRDLVLVRKGYHPVVAAPGFDVYYLNYLAGDHPLWVVYDDPELAWVRQTWGPREPLSLPLTD